MYEYKCVGAPEKGKRGKRVRTRSDRVATAMQEIIADEAVDGWEYLRTDLVPVEEKSGIFSRVQEVHRAVLVFRRMLPQQSRRLFEAPAGAPYHAPEAAPVTHPMQAPPPMSDPALRRPASETDEDYRIAAERLRPDSMRAPEPSPGPNRSRRAPSGLS